MILSITVHDNDYTSIIEKYLKHFKFKNYKAFVYEISDLRRFRDTTVLAEDLLEKVIYKSNELTDKEKEQFEGIVKTSLLYYITDKDTKELFNRDVEIKLSDTIKDQWQNGEVVYLFINQDKTIVM